jgi:hypothetical protein
MIDYIGCQPGAIVVTGTHGPEAFKLISEYMSKNGEGPTTVCMNLSRSTEMKDVDWVAMESIKDGRFDSTKYVCAGMCACVCVCVCVCACVCVCVCLFVCMFTP